MMRNAGLKTFMSSEIARGNQLSHHQLNESHKYNEIHSGDCNKSANLMVMG